jgi:hypothetical protein
LCGKCWHFAVNGDMFCGKNAKFVP